MPRTLDGIVDLGILEIVPSFVYADITSTSAVVFISLTVVFLVLAVLIIILTLVWRDVPVFKFARGVYLARMNVFSLV